MPHSAGRLRLDRRLFLAGLPALGVGTAAALAAEPAASPSQAGEGTLTVAQLEAAAAVAGLSFSAEEYAGMLAGVQQNLDRYRTLRAQTIENDLAPPFNFTPLVPGMRVDRTRRPLRLSEPPTLARPVQIEELAFWPVTHLAALVRARKVSSLELTQLFLARLRRHNPQLNCVVSFCDERALRQARAADAEIAAGKYRGPLHGIPWGCKDIIAVKGYRTTWGSGAYEQQVIDEDATVVRLLDEAGAVMIAKLTTGELAGGDQWFGGRTNNPWNLEEGASGSSAGPGSAVTAGCVPFALGTETSGSILSPSARCGATGLRPTFGRVSRHGAMALSWTQDRIGPICRFVEDCATVLAAIARPDDLDLSVSELPFNYDARLPLKSLRVGYLVDAFADADRLPEWIANDTRSLATLRGLGIELVPLAVPDFPAEVLNISVEAAVFFDELLRSGQYRRLTAASKADRFRISRFVPAVEYLQSQRLRSRMMQQLAAATAAVDVYLAPSTGGNPRPPGGDNAPRTQNRTQQHFQMANLACYPGLALPNGFAASGSPTSITFMARPFGEGALLAVAKAYQDATDFNRRKPPLKETAS
jgi:Asp-tRNA(Asn)/Glu-tRNA(Gln) amidotransferase A subunit family amidase